MLTSWGKDGVSRWDVMRGKLLGESPFPVKGWRYVAHTADLSRFALYVPKQGVTFWEPASGKVTGKLKGEKLTVEGGLAFTPDGKRLMTLHAAEKERTSTAKLWDVASGELLRSFPLPPFQGLGPAFSPDGKTVILPAMGPGFHLWDVDAGKPQLACEGHQFSLGAVAFTPDGKTILTGSTDLVQTWDVATGKPRLALEGRYFAPLAAVMLDNRSALIAGADRSTLRLYDLASGKAVGSFTLSAEEQPGYGALRRSADGKMILGLGQDEGRWKLSLWELATGKRVQERLLRADEPYDDLLAGGDWLAGILRGPATDTKDVPPANVPDVFVVHDWKKERVLLRVELPGGWDSRAVESPDRQTLATIATELVLTETGNRLGRSYVQLWEIASGQVRLEIVRDPGKPESYFAQLALSPDGRTLATVWDTRAIQLWDVVTGKELLHLQAESQIQQLVFSPDGRTLATGLNDGTVLLWDVRSATERKPPRRELGQLGTAEARTVLAALAKGDPAARTTQAAQAALTRLGQ
jgi:WD40 repeat protein